MFYVNEESINRITHLALRSLIGSGTALETQDKILTIRIAMSYSKLIIIVHKDACILL
jgi:hypothetical protein